MKMNLISIFTFVGTLLCAANVSASTLQQFNISNSLYNQDATGGNAGQTPTSVLVKLFLSGATSPCYSTTLAYEGSTTVSTGTGFSCTQTVTSITFTPVASAVGTMYTAPSAFSPTMGQFTTQIAIVQTPATSSSFGPVFDTTNGLVTTPGSITINSQ